MALKSGKDRGIGRPSGSCAMTQPAGLDQARDLPQGAHGIVLVNQEQPRVGKVERPAGVRCAQVVDVGGEGPDVSQAKRARHGTGAAGRRRVQVDAGDPPGVAD